MKVLKGLIKKSCFPIIFKLSQEELSEDHHFDNVTLEHLAKEPLILREDGSGTRMMAEKFFKSHAIRPRVRLSLGSNEAIKEAVAGGLGCAILSQHALTANASEPSISILNIEGFPIQSQWFTVTVHGKKLGPVASVFRSYLREASRAISENLTR